MKSRKKVKAIEKDKSDVITKVGEDNEFLSTKIHPGEQPTFGNRLEQLTSQPRRRAEFHWAAFALSLVSLGFLIAWMVGPRGEVPFSWVVLDITLSALFVFEFISRSGIRWNTAKYIVAHLFDFIAIVPALALVNHGFMGQEIWLWLIMVARVARAVDRILGDGFLRRNILALAEGFEEEITDRVLQRIITRVQTDLYHGKFGEGIAVALEQNKSKVLNRIEAELPFEGVGGSLAQLVGLDTLLKRVEERTFDAIVNVLKSPEIDRTIRESVDSIFTTMRKEMGAKTWRDHLGLKGGPFGPHEHKYQ